MSQFAKLKIGDKFFVGDELYKKVSLLTYESLDNPVLGEFYSSPLIEGKIVPVNQTKTAKAVKKPVTKAKTVKKTQ